MLSYLLIFPSYINLGEFGVCFRRDVSAPCCQEWRTAPPPGRFQPIQQMGKKKNTSHLWANTGRIVKMNNLLNRDCLLTALSLFTSQLLNIPVKRLGVSPWPTPSFFSQAGMLPASCFSLPKTFSISFVRSGSNYSCSVMTLSILS